MEDTTTGDSDLNAAYIETSTAGSATDEPGMLLLSTEATARHTGADVE